MSEATQIVLAQIAQLAAVGGVTTSRDEVVRPRGYGSLLKAADQIAAAVDHGRLEQLAGPPGPDGPLISDLFAFLAAMPMPVRKEIETDAASSAPPARAWDEHTAGPFWNFSALIQDVWEHTFGPELADDPRILDLLRRLDLRDVHDTGAGAGFFTFHLARMGVRVVCSETNLVKRTFLRFRRDRRPEGQRISLEAGGDRFGAVLTINVLDHLRHPVQAVRAVAKRLRPGGLLICCAAFPDDGWHRGGRHIREAVFRELMRHFHYPEPARESFDSSVVLVRRKRSLADPRRKPAPGVRYRLHPAAMLSPAPADSTQFVISAPRFYVQPLLLSPEAAELTRLWRKANTLTGMLRRAKRMGGAQAEVRAALNSMFRAHLLVPAGERAG